MNQRLLTYLNSGLLVLPRNIANYKQGRDLADMCLFCERIEHNEIPVYMLRKKGDLSSGVDTGAYCCYDCSSAINEVSQDYVGLLPTPGILGTVTDDTFSRLELYAKYNRFDMSVERHYRHLDPSYDSGSNCCYFCKQSLTKNQFSIIRVPVSNVVSTLSGGDIGICKTCVNTLKDTFNSGIDVFGRTSSTLDVCVECRSRYLIAPDELEYRTSNGQNNLGKHLCPECAHHQMMDTEPNRLLYVYKRNRLNRFLPHNCYYCKEKFIVDVSLPRNYLFYLHMSKRKQIICLECVHMGEEPVIVLRISVWTLKIYKENFSYLVREVSRAGNIYDSKYNMPIRELIIFLMLMYSKVKDKDSLF